MAKILLSNDDGVYAPGINTLYQAIIEDHQVTMLAPMQERSTTGHSLSLDMPLRLHKIKDSIYGCTGFPADCVLMGLGHLCESNRPDLVVSGINRGANLGQDLYYSGTMAAAREAAFHGVRSVSVSLCCDAQTQDYHFETAALFMKKLLSYPLEKLIGDLCVLNINVPNLPMSKIKGVKYTTVGFRQYSEQVEARVDPRHRNYYWVVGNYKGHRSIGGTDCDAVSDGHIAFTPHQLVNSVPCDLAPLKELAQELSDFGQK